MKPLVAGINLDGHGLAQSVNAMHTSMNIMGIFGENILGFDKIGYQKKDVVISSFAEFLGPEAVSYSTDEQVGRLVMTERPLDLALSEKGYFQVLNDNGSIELTRDGRFKLNDKGELLTQTNQKVLSNSGIPIVFSTLPTELNKIKIGTDGKIGVVDENARGLVVQGTIGVVSSDGALIQRDTVRQGFVENSNIQLQNEFIEIANYKRTFEANSTMFKIQNNKLSNAISQLGRV